MIFINRKWLVSGNIKSVPGITRTPIGPCIYWVSPDQHSCLMKYLIYSLKLLFFAISQVAISFPAAIIINEKTAPPTWIYIQITSRNRLDYTYSFVFAIKFWCYFSRFHFLELFLILNIRCVFRSRQGWQYTYVPPFFLKSLLIHVLKYGPYSIYQY